MVEGITGLLPPEQRTYVGGTGDRWVGEGTDELQM